MPAACTAGGPDAVAKPVAAHVPLVPGRGPDRGTVASLLAPIGAVARHRVPARYAAAGPDAVGVERAMGEPAPATGEPLRRRPACSRSPLAAPRCRGEQ